MDREGRAVCRVRAVEAAVAVTSTFRLDPEQVAATFAACESTDDDALEIDAIATSVRLSETECKRHGELILAMLLELPDEFRASAGGGWSFLNACMDRHGNQWTGLHARMAQLFALGMGAGLVECQLPRSVWDVLPGGMPYYVIKDKT